MKFPHELLDKLTKNLLDDFDWFQIKKIQEAERIKKEMEQREKKRAKIFHKVLWWFYWKKTIHDFWK